MPSLFSSLNFKSSNGSTPNLSACFASVNSEDMWKDETLLYTALKKKQYDIAALLIKNGAKVDIKSFNYIKKKKLENKLIMVLNWLF